MDWGALLEDTSNHPSYPIIKKIVADLERDYACWRDTVRAFELATVNSSAGVPDARAEALQDEAQSLAVDIESYVAELSYLGVHVNVKDLFGEMP
jgi:hypothetical protein